MLSTSPSPFSSGPIALLVLLQLQAWNSHARLVRRQRGGGGDSDSDSDSDSDNDSESCQNNVCTKTSCKKGVCTTITSTRGVPLQTPAPQTPGPNGTSQTLGVSQTPAPNSVVTNSNTNHHTTRSQTSGLSADPSLHSGTAASSNHSGGFSKGGIAGIVIAIVVISGLIFMCLSKYRNRIRRAKKRPQGFVPAAFLTGSNFSRSNTSNNNNEMSQVDFGNRSPVIAAAHMNRNVGRNGDSSYSSVPSTPLSPLIPAVTPGYDGRPLSPGGGHSQRNLTRSSSRNENGSVLTSPYSEIGHAANLNWANTPLPPLPPDANGVATAGIARSPSANGGGFAAGVLHSDMRAYQKALEADSDKQGASGRLSQDPGNDPPPSYFPAR